MRYKYLLLYILIFQITIWSQNSNLISHFKFNNKNFFSQISFGKIQADSINLSDVNNKSLIDTIQEKSDSLKVLPVNPDTTKKSQNKTLDSTLYSKYGYLKDDDPEFNKKAPLWRPILGTIGGNLVTCAVNRYILGSDFCRISFKTIENNFENGWEWDTDRFGINFLAHPYSGAMGFNHGRVEGYNFWESIPFAFGSSLMWEQFMENTRPSYNDLINTTLSGTLLGEILYRLSSSFLDDRIVGSKRVLRELMAGIIDPTRFFNRIYTGKYKRVVDKDIYQREPLQASVFAGVRNMNEGTGFWEGEKSGEFVLNFSYGDPLEERSRKPYDYFKFRVALSVGAGKKIVNNVMGYGILTGKNITTKNSGILYGIFQNYDYWDNNIDELGAVGIGGGIIHRLNLSKETNITSHFHAGVIPMAGIKSPLADSVGERNYNYVGGLEGMAESSISIGGFVNISASYFFYAAHVYVGHSGNYFIGVFRPRIALKIFNDFYVGYDFVRYGKDGYLNNLPDIHVRNNEQRFFISISSGYFGIP